VDFRADGSFTPAARAMSRVRMRAVKRLHQWKFKQTESARKEKSSSQKAKTDIDMRYRGTYVELTDLRYRIIHHTSAPAWKHTTGRCSIIRYLIRILVSEYVDSYNLQKIEINIFRATAFPPYTHPPHTTSYRHEPLLFNIHPVS
jgi:hypothetical protein